jgi:hypothetical protein
MFDIPWGTIFFVVFCCWFTMKPILKLLTTIINDLSELKRISHDLSELKVKIDSIERDVSELRLRDWQDG